MRGSLRQRGKNAKAWPLVVDLGRDLSHRGLGVSVAEGAQRNQRYSVRKDTEDSLAGAPLRLQGRARQAGRLSTRSISPGGVVCEA